jgi:hypothetical protein
VALSKRHQLDDGGFYDPSALQVKLLTLWDAFWQWAYDHVGKDAFVLVHVGDITDGVHHRTTQLSSANLTTQSRLAVEMMQPHVVKAEKYFQIRGTEAHVGQSAQEEEAIAKTLGAVKDDAGNYARWMLWMKFGGRLINFAHHLGHTSSSAYESSALMREIVANFAESGQYGFKPAGILVRGHTHRYLKIEGPGGWIGIKLPGWQLKTGFVHKMDRMRGPMIGGCIISDTKEGVDVRAWVQTVKETRAIEIS